MVRFDGDRGWSIGRLAEEVFQRGTRPFVLKLAETFLVLICGIYLTKLAVLAMGMHAGYGDGFLSILTFVVDVAMLFITADSLLSVSSRRPKAWKKAVRAAMLLVVFNLIAWFGTGSMTAASLVTMNPLIVTPLALFVMAVMFWSPIRRYYMPMMEEELSLWSWFKFAWFSPLYTSESYRIMYDDDRERSGLLRESRDGIRTAISSHAVVRRIFGRDGTGGVRPACGADSLKRIASARCATPHAGAHLLSRLRAAVPPLEVRSPMAALETSLRISSASLYSGALTRTLYLGHPTQVISTSAPSAASMPLSRASRTSSMPLGA